MIDGVMTGIKRLVMQLVAQAVFLAGVSLFTGIPIGQLMKGSDGIMGKLGGLIGGGKSGGGVVPALSPLGGNVDFKIKGTDLVGVLSNAGRKSNSFG
jgi:hypothetical protein